MAKMKLQKIADLSLKNMIITYHDTNRTRFDMDFFTTLFTEETQDHITNALQVFVWVSFAIYTNKPPQCYQH